MKQVSCILISSLLLFSCEFMNPPKFENKKDAPQEVVDPLFTMADTVVTTPPPERELSKVEIQAENQEQVRKNREYSQKLQSEGITFSYKPAFLRDGTEVIKVQYKNNTNLYFISVQRMRNNGAGYVLQTVAVDILPKSTGSFFLEDLKKQNRGDNEIFSLITSDNEKVSFIGGYGYLPE